MAKTRHRVVKDDVEREPEAPAHKTRRQFKQQLQAFNYDEEWFEDADDEFERVERIRRSRKAS